MSDLVYQREQWQKRAQAAQDCADELGELARALARVVERNYFGDGCVEGQIFFGKLRAVVDDGLGSLDRIATEAAILSTGAERAVLELEAADAAGEELVGPR